MTKLLKNQRMQPRQSPALLSATDEPTKGVKGLRGVDFASGMAALAPQGPAAGRPKDRPAASPRPNMGTKTTTPAMEPLKAARSEAARRRAGELAPEGTTFDFQEELARGVGYGKDGENAGAYAASERKLAQMGYTGRVITVAYDNLQMTLVPAKDGQPPTLVLAGTNFKENQDVYADLGPWGIGKEMFKAHRDEIQSALEGLAAGAPDGRVVVTGHSLGGALAQHTAAAFPKRVKQVITFNSPGAGITAPRKLARWNAAHPDQAVPSTHFVNRFDLVDNAGMNRTEGTEVAMDTGGSKNPLARHTAEMDLRGATDAREVGARGIAPIDDASKLSRGGFEALRLGVGSTGALLKAGANNVAAGMKHAASKTPRPLGWPGSKAKRT